VRIIIVDSIAFHYRSFNDYQLRDRSLAQICSFLRDLSIKEGIAVVLVNQMTTQIKKGGGTQHVPALGETFAHASSTRLILERRLNAAGSSGGGGREEEEVRECRLVKSPNRPMGVGLYRLREEGVRGVAVAPSSSSSSSLKTASAASSSNMSISNRSATSSNSSSAGKRSEGGDSSSRGAERKKPKN
jgi:RAD51-like protein 2